MAGKGDKWRRTDFKKYREADYWKEVDRKRKPKKSRKAKECCGNCNAFTFEDTAGKGWCGMLAKEVKCGGLCEYHEYKED